MTGTLSRTRDYVGLLTRTRDVENELGSRIRRRVAAGGVTAGEVNELIRLLKELPARPGRAS